jgi:hypothetical protein
MSCRITTVVIDAVSEHSRIEARHRRALRGVSVTPQRPAERSEPSSCRSFRIVHLVHPPAPANMPLEQGDRLTTRPGLCENVTTRTPLSACPGIECSGRTLEEEDRCNDRHDCSRCCCSHWCSSSLPASRRSRHRLPLPLPAAPACSGDQADPIRSVSSRSSRVNQSSWLGC